MSIIFFVVGFFSLGFLFALPYIIDKLPFSTDTVIALVIVATAMFFVSIVIAVILYKPGEKKGAPDRSIVGVEYLGVVDEVDKRGGLRGGLLGGLLYGPLGIPIGSLLPMGTKPVCRFAVTYGDGRTEIRDCVKGSGDYNYLNQYITFGSFKKHK